jgi:hypothetical protein
LDFNDDGTAAVSPTKQQNRMDRQCAWVAEHIDELYPEDTQLTFETVIHMHPYAGCAFSPLGVNPQHEMERAKETADIAKYADAVTVCCLESEALRRQIAVPLDDTALFKVNETTIANLAYIGLHHSMPSVRQQCLDTVSRWQRQRTQSRILGELGIMLFVLFVLLYRNTIVRGWIRALMNKTIFQKPPFE